MFKDTLVIINPVARSGKASLAAALMQTTLPKIINHIGLNHEIKFVYTVGPNDGEKLAQELGASYNTVITLGGDGLVHEVANGLMKIEKENRPQLAVIPCGNGDDYGRSLGMSRKPKEALAQLKTCKPVSVDLGCVNGEYFTETLSFGLDAAIALGTMEKRKTTSQTGTILYLQCGFDQLKNHMDIYNCTMVLDDSTPLTTPLYLIAVQNGAHYGGGFKICPDANVSDGCLDICYAKPTFTFMKALKLFLKAKDGKHVGNKNLEFTKAKKVELSFDRSIPAQIDGEKISADHYSISVEHDALKVFIPTV